MRILNSLLSALLVTLLLSSFTDNASAQGVNPEALGSSIIRDVNGDGEVSILAVGDSITRGRGDFIGVGEDIEVTPAPGAEEAGYPLRIELLVGVSVLNRGISGQQLIADELPRFASTVPSASADIVIIGGGSNDAIFRALGTDIFKAVQTMINIAHASGVEPMLTTIPPTCCERAALNTFIDDYNLKLLDLARINNIPIADVHRGFANSCTLSTCHLLNQPEGLHPNIDGYDVMGDVVIAALFGIDIFSSDGASELEQALGLVPGSVKTKPDRAPETTTEEGSS